MKVFATYFVCFFCIMLNIHKYTSIIGSFWLGWLMDDSVLVDDGYSLVDLPNQQYVG